MAFFKESGTDGIMVNGHSLSEFSARLLTNYQTGACALTTDTFQGLSRSTILLLGQTFGAMEIVLPLEFWGTSRRDTVEKWSQFCHAASGAVELDLRDGYIYACCVTDFGKPAWISDGWLSVDVTLRGLRQKPAVTVSAQSTIGASVLCESTFPRTDCVLTLPSAVLQGAEMVNIELGDNAWYLEMEFPAPAELVLDGVRKIFTLNGENITARMQWEDFPYLVPGENSIGVYINAIGVTRGVELTYWPTFL